MPSTDSIEVAALIHAFDQTVWSHICPILIDEIKASGTAVRFMDYGPTFGDLYKAWPKGMLSFLIDENMKDAVFVFERIGHFVLQSTLFRCLLSSPAIVLPISAAACGPSMAS